MFKGHQDHSTSVSWLSPHETSEHEFKKSRTKRCSHGNFREEDVDAFRQLVGSRVRLENWAVAWFRGAPRLVRGRKARITPIHKNGNEEDV